MILFIIILSALMVSSIAPKAEAVNFAEFQYITNHEITVFGSRIPFFGSDTLYGWVHSNDQIAIMQNPVFFGPVTTSAQNFYYYGGANPYFFYEPIFNYPEAEFPEEFTELREAAYQQGHFFDDLGTSRKYILKFRGAQGYEVFKRWQEVPIDTYITTIPPLIGGAVFFDDTLEMTGTDTVAQIDYGVYGQLSVGASGDIWLGGNIRYVTANLYTGAFDWEIEINYLGILSESNILIRNNWENGRDNGAVQTSIWRKDIIIDASVFALGESFSFEDQNDDSSAGGGQLPEWYYSNGPYPDERGDIHLWGSLAQYRRGYVHRSNHSGTGYGKDYNYDQRLSFNSPPYFPTLPAVLSFSADTLDFGEVAVGYTAIQALWIFNGCMDSINVLSWSYTNPVFSGPFPGQPLYCPNDSTAMIIYFHPDTAGSFDGLFILRTDEGDFSIVLIGVCSGVGIDAEKQSPTPDNLRFYEAYPNPFNPETNLTYDIPETGDVSLIIYDVQGMEVARLVDGRQSAGTYHITFDGCGLSSGVYFACLKANGFTQTRKLLLIR